MSEEQINNSDSRQLWIDCLKAVCAFLIVMQHSLSVAWTQGNIYSSEWILVNSIMIIAKEGVPLFFMCSGYGMLCKERSVKSCIRAVLRLLYIYFAWMAVYGFFEIAQLLLEHQSLYIIISSFVKKLLFGNYHVWFLFELMGLYLLTPVFYPIMQNKIAAKYTVTLSFIAAIIIPLTQNINGIGRFEYTVSAFNISALSGNIFYYLMGYFLGYHIQISNAKAKKIGGVLVILSVLYIVINILSICYDRVHDDVYGIFFDDKGIVGSIFVINIFLLFRLCDKSKHRTRWEMLSKLGLPIYMMHPLVLQYCVVFLQADASDILIGVAIYLCSLCISYFLFKLKYTRYLFIMRSP